MPGSAVPHCADLALWPRAGLIWDVECVFGDDIRPFTNRRVTQRIQRALESGIAEGHMSKASIDHAFAEAVDRAASRCDSLLYEKQIQWAATSREETIFRHGLYGQDFLAFLSALCKARRLYHKKAITPAERDEHSLTATRVDVLISKLLAIDQDIGGAPQYRLTMKTYLGEVKEQRNGALVDLFFTGFLAVLERNEVITLTDVDWTQRVHILTVTITNEPSDDTLEEEALRSEEMEIRVGLRINESG